MAVDVPVPPEFVEVAVVVPVPPLSVEVAAVLVLELLSPDEVLVAFEEVAEAEPLSFELVLEEEDVTMTIPDIPWPPGPPWNEQ